MLRSGGIYREARGRHPDAVSELVRLGATVTGKHRISGHAWTVMQDPEGNEFCIAAKSFTGFD